MPINGAIKQGPVLRLCSTLVAVYSKVRVC